MMNDVCTRKQKVGNITIEHIKQRSHTWRNQASREKKPKQTAQKVYNFQQLTSQNLAYKIHDAQVLSYLFLTTVAYQIS